MNQSPRWVKTVALFLTGVMLAVLSAQAGFGLGIEGAIAQQNRTMPTDQNACAVLTAPLTSEEQGYAKAAWQYFAKNYQPETGFMNATGGYPSGTLWDMGNYLVALNTARWLDLITQKEFDEKLNKFLSTFGSLKLFDEALPNKVYHAANGQMVDYGNNPTPRGIGWSALDIGRILAAFHIIRTCHPQYADWLKGITQRWQIARSLQDDQLYGATVTPDGKTLLVQEGRLGYEEYAVRGYELWGYKADKAKSFQPFQFVDVYGIQIPVDVRDYQKTNANNYVVSESYILDGIEFGWQGEQADYAGRVLEAQRRRYSQTGQLTAVTEDNIDAPPYFIYNTVYANGVPWAAITDQNQPIPQFRSISTKAAFGWHYLYPTNEYAQKVFDAVKNLRSPKDDGYYAGLYEATQKPNTSLTGNTNGLILEILYYKARGNRPLIARGEMASPLTMPPAPIPAVDTPTNTTACPRLSQPLSLVERRYAQAAWQYFRANAQATGLINDRSDFKGVTLWGLGDYLAALRAARTLEVITPNDFDQRIRQLFGTMQQLPLYGGELPNRGYDPWSLQPVDYGGNPVPGGTGWSAADLGRFLAALYGLKTCYPEYTDAVDHIVLDWSYVRVVRDRALNSGTVTQDETGRMLTRTVPETRLGYSEYAARAFQLWGFEVDRAAVGEHYIKTNVEGFEVPVQRQGVPKTSDLAITVSEPFLLYGLEFGFDPQMRSLAEPLFKAQAERFRRTKRFTAANTAAINSPPYILHSTLVGNGQAWANLDAQGNPAKGDRLVSTSVAFALYALFPDESYSRELWQTVTDLYNPQLGYYEGFYETSGKRENNQAANTNSLILQALLYRATRDQPLLRPTSMNSPWWKAIASGDTSRGLPSRKQQTAKFVTEGTQTYWVSTNLASETVLEQSPVATEPIPVPAPSPAALQPTPQPTTTAAQSAIILPLPRPIPSPALPESTSPQPKPEAAQPTKVVPLVSSESDAIAAKRAWKYFERNWNPQTGLVNAVDQLTWTTLWDQGSALLGIHAGRQLGLMTAERFDQRMNVLLKTLETLPIPATGLPNKAYSTSTAQMRQLDDTPDPKGTSGWSVLDIARLLVGLNIIKQHYPEYGDRIHHIVKRWQLPKLVTKGWLIGGIATPSGIQAVQEGRLGYEQYAAYGLQQWGVEATQALHHPPARTIKVDGVLLQVDQRELKNSGASNYLTSDPYLLWGLELGWAEMVKPQVQNLFKVQAQRYQRTKIVTAVNEDSLDRPPYFLYYSVYANGQPWHAINVQGKAFPHLRFVSTKAAFAWSVLMQGDAYAKLLRDTVQNLANPNRGYFSGRYEDSSLGENTSIDVNTNAIILESLLYKARGEQPLAL